MLQPTPALGGEDLGRANQARYAVPGGNQDDGPTRRDDHRVYRLRAPQTPRLTDVPAHDGDPGHLELRPRSGGNPDAVVVGAAATRRFETAGTADRPHRATPGGDHLGRPQAISGSAGGQPRPGSEAYCW